MKFIDVTVPLSSSMPVYPGNAPFTVEPVKRLSEGDSSNVSTFHMSAHSGTHVDAPRHYFENGAGVETLPLDLLIGRTRVVAIPTRKGIGERELAELDLRDDIRVLIRTTNSALWHSPEFSAEYAHLTEEGARYLVDSGLKVVGIDYLSVEQYKKPGAPAHRALLGGGVIIVEGLNLSDVEPGVYEMFCLPLPAVGSDAAPARVVLKRS